MGEIRDFSRRLKDILAEQGLSASELARRMRLNSRNSLFRILNNEASYKKQKEFFDHLRETGAMRLPDEAWCALEEGLEVTRVGEDSFLSHRALTDFIFPSTSVDRPICVTFHSDGPARTADFRAVLQEMARGRERRLTIVGCYDPALFRQIAEELLSTESGRGTSITHYIDATGVELVQAIAAVRPVIYAECYQAYMPQPEETSRELRDLYGGNMLLASYTDETGVHRCVEMIMTGAGGFQAYHYANEGAFRFLMDLLGANQERMQAVKSIFVQPAGPEDYLLYTEKYRRLELDTNLYSVKCDVPVNFIHPDLLLGSVRDGFAATGFGVGEQLERLINAFYDVHLARWENFFKSRKVTHTIFTYEAMRSFAMTGLQSDHFFAMRPYTRSERREILCFLREQTERNPYFTLYFYKGDRMPDRGEIGIYEGKGVLLTRANTNYRLDGEHAEALITQPEFCQRFRRYYLQKLLAHHVTGAQETLALLSDLIALCDGPQG